MLELNQLYNMDCLEGMKQFPDKYFELAVVDPPYGININHNIGRRKGDKHSDYKKVNWDNDIPTAEYFAELYRVSKKSNHMGRELLLYATNKMLHHMEKTTNK